MQDPDFVIVGGGSAGAVLAARLSEDPGTRVLLIEAGPDTPPDAVPADVADTFPSSYLNRGYFWPDLQAIRAAGEAPRPLLQARVMGGGSSVMGMWALRGLPSDYEAWLAAGAEGWGPQDVMACFRRLEGDLDRDHAQAPPGARARGPNPIRRLPAEEWPGFVTAIERAATARGFRPVADINESRSDGFFAMPLSQDTAARASSARCYLTAEVRRRSNLAVMPRTHVTALRLDGARACGVVVERDGRSEQIAAREVIVCAGAIHSPALLLRAGIGPAAELQRLGIAPVVDRAGVGRNLQNHAYLHFGLTPQPQARLAGHLRRFAIAGLRVSSGLPDCPAGDLLVFTIARVSPRAFGTDFAMLGAALYAPFSRGAVTLASADPRAGPRIDFNMFSDPRDAPRMVKAARLAEELLHDPTVAATWREAYLLPPDLPLYRLNRPGVLGVLTAIAAKAVLNGPAPLRRAVVGGMVHPGRSILGSGGRADLSDRDLLGAAVPMVHPAGTCAMGRPGDPRAVLDPACRVYGVANLRVVDASVMPQIPSANTNLPTLMVAERAAELIRKGYA